MRSAQAGRIVHAMIFCGPEGTGRHEAARTLSAFLLCASADKPCGACPQCLRVQRGLHPDVLTVSPPDASAAIGVERIRQLGDQLSVRPFEGGRRAVIIDRSDQMTESAQNALLKMLEEARSCDYFMLIAEHRSSLLPTIVSRSRFVRFSPSPVSELARELAREGEDPSDAALASTLSQGSPGRARRFLSEGFSSWQRAEKLLRSIAAGDPQGACAAFPKDPGERRDVIDCLEAWARDRMLREIGCTDAAFTESCPDIPLSGLDLLSSIYDLRLRLQFNMSVQNAMESLCLTLTEVRP